MCYDYLGGHSRKQTRPYNKEKQEWHLILPRYVWIKLGAVDCILAWWQARQDYHTHTRTCVRTPRGLCD